MVFTRGATEAINLVARSCRRRAATASCCRSSSITATSCPWQLAGYEVDVVPLTADGRIDLDAAEAMLTEEHRVVAFAHVSNVLGSVLDAKRAAEIAHAEGAQLLLDGCQAVPRMPVDVAAIGCDFYAFSGHKLYGPTGIGCLWGRAELLDAMPPWQGGGAMIDTRDVREDDLSSTAGAVRGGDAAHRRRGRAARGGRLGREARPRRDPRARMRAGRRDAARRCRASPA